jgi:hypothetical protein
MESDGVWQGLLFFGARRVRAFLRFCQRLQPPRIQNKPTLPFTHPELLKILVSLEGYGKAPVLPMHRGYERSSCCFATPECG